MFSCRSDPTTLLPTLWIGTTLGTVLTMMINLPEADLRHTQPVVVSSSGMTHHIYDVVIHQDQIIDIIRTILQVVLYLG